MEIPESPPSSPLSLRSRSPSPPTGFGYPSPTSTQLSGSRSPSKSRDVPPPTLDSDGPPPPKKRKLVEPKPRTTEYLDLRQLDDCIDGDRDAKQEAQLQRLLHVLRKKRKIVVIAGAGISVSAGIPDFRSSTGLFTTLRSQHKLKASGKHLFDAAVYKTDSSTTSFHDMVRELSHLTRSAEPTIFHHMLATLSEEGRLMRLYTQNVDGIDTALEPLATNVPLDPKGPWPRTIQLHGGLEKMVCTKCGTLSDFKGVLFEGPEPPSCEACKETEHVRTTIAGKRGHGIGRLRPRIVLYNEYNPDEEAIGAVTRADLRNRPDAVIVVGTSLKVPGVRRIAREMCSVARGRRDGFTAWINNGPEPMGVEFKDCWDLVVRGDCDEVARQAALPRWDDKYMDPPKEVAGEDWEKSRGAIEVVVDVKHKAVEETQGMLTPTASPRHQSPAPAKTTWNMKQSKLVLNGSNGSDGSKGLKGSKGSKTTREGPLDTSTNTTKAKTKKPRKSTTVVKKPIQKITSSFLITKTGQKVDVKLEKSSQAIPIVQRAPLFPGLSALKTPEPMRTISNSELRVNYDSSPLSQVSGDDDSELLAEQLHYSMEKRRETISPSSKPTNMGNLID